MLVVREQCVYRTFYMLNYWCVVIQETEIIDVVLTEVVRRGSSIVSPSDAPGGTIG